MQHNNDAMLCRGEAPEYSPISSLIADWLSEFLWKELSNDPFFSCIHLPSCFIFRWSVASYEIKCEVFFCYQPLYFFRNMSACITQRSSGVFSQAQQTQIPSTPQIKCSSWILSHQVQGRIFSFISATMSVRVPRRKTRWTGNKSDYGVRGVMFNNKKYYLPRSMCVAVAIKYNEWKVLGARSKFWCVVILNTLWQHTACQGCKTSSNRLLNILPLNSYTPWLPYIKPGPQHAKG